MTAHKRATPKAEAPPKPPLPPTGDELLRVIGDYVDARDGVQEAQDDYAQARQKLIEACERLGLGKWDL